MAGSVTIAGEDRRIADFSAFKAIWAMTEISRIQSTFRDVLVAGAEFKREFEATHYVEMTRAEARRQFRPRVLVEEVPIERDGQMIVEDGVPLLRQAPMIRDGQPVMGADPLGHLTDADWEANGNVLKIPDSPGRNLEIAAMVEAGFRLARPQALRLIALAVAANADLEKWDTDGGDEEIAAQLDAEAKRIVHAATAAELVRLAIVVVELSRDQLAGPFGEMAAALKSIRRTTSTSDTTDRPPEPMRIETADSTSQPTSSTGSPDGTAGLQTSSSIESPSDSLPASASA